jgi:hypothetical protein
MFKSVLALVSIQISSALAAYYSISDFYIAHDDPSKSALFPANPIIRS